MLYKKFRLGFLVIISLPCFLLSFQKAIAHGSEQHIGYEIIDGNWASANGDVIIGPGAHIEVTGDWFLTASRIYIYPTATITGTGTIHLMNPNVYGQASAPTQLDGGGITISCKLSLENPAGITLVHIDPVTAFPGINIGSEGSPPIGSDNVEMNNDLNFNCPGAYLLLNDYDLIFSAGFSKATYSDLNDGSYVPFNPTPGTPADAYIVTNGAGVVNKRSVNIGAFTFPVGQSFPNDYTPAAVTNNATPQGIAVQVKNYAASASVENTPQKGIDRTWTIYASTGSGVSGAVTISLTHNTITNGTLFNNSMAFITQQVTPGVWSSSTSTANGGSPTSTHTRSGITISNISNRYFTKSSDQANPLRLNLLSFNALNANDRIYLEWKTSNEINTSHFEIQRSANGIEFNESIALINSAGNNTAESNYSAYDFKPLKGKNYYRLKMVDHDNAFTYSPVELVNSNTNSANNISVSPNPVNSSAQISITADKEETVQYLLIDAAGKKVQAGKLKLSSGVNKFSLGFKELQAGVYLLLINGQAIKAEVKIEKQ